MIDDETFVKKIAFFWGGGGIVESAYRGDAHPLFF